MKPHGNCLMFPAPSNPVNDVLERASNAEAKGEDDTNVAFA
jgi:hypothetical protein